MYNANPPKLSKDELTNGWKNTVDIYINLSNTNFSREVLYELFLKLCFFKPSRMEIYTKNLKSSKRYNKEIFKQAILDTYSIRLGIYNSNGQRIESSVNSHSTIINIRMSLKVWEDYKLDIVGKIDELFVALKGCFAFVVNAFDYNVVQNPDYVTDYINYKIDESDFLDIDKVAIIPSKDPALNDKIDLSCLPGSKLEYNNMIFTTAPYMWFGDSFFDCFSEYELKKFDDCVENIEYSENYRRICLWENITEYNERIYRNRQKRFRDLMQLDYVVGELNSKNNFTEHQDPQIEFVRGQFSHGGELLIKFYLDRNEKPCIKSMANTVIIHEMKENLIVWKEKINVETGDGETGDDSPSSN